jgi:hypothetical protein
MAGPTGINMRARISTRWLQQIPHFQQIFDSVWSQLQREGKANPQDAAMRKEVAIRVWAFAKAELLDADAIKQAVLRSFRSRSHGNIIGQ